MIVNRAHGGNRRAMLAHDAPGVAALVCIVMAILPRLWTVLAAPSAAAFARFPVLYQATVLAVFAGQLGAETWGTVRVRVVAATLCTAAAAASAGLFMAADWRAGNWPSWAALALVEGAIVWRLALAIGRTGGKP